MRDEARIEGEASVLAATEQRMLDAPGETWRVVEGHLLVYLALSDEYGLVGPPRYVTTRREGQILVGAAAVDRESGLFAALMVVAGERAAIARAEDALEADAAAEWALVLCRDLLARAPGAPAQTSEQRDVISAPADGLFRPRGTELTLVTLTAGAAALAGVPEAGMTPEDGVVALNSAAWFRAGQDGASAALTAPEARDPRLPDAARAATRLWLAAAFAAMRAERAAEAERLARAESRRGAERAKAVEALRLTEDESRPLTSRPDDPLAAALEIVGDDLGVAFDPRPLEDDRRPIAERLARSAELGGARARRVSLSGPWTNGDAGVILAFAENGLPRVFIPRMRAFNMGVDYERIAPELGERRRIRPADLDELSETGFTFVAALPEVLDDKGEVDFWQLSMFTLRPQFPDMKQVMLLMLVGMGLGMLTPIGHFIIIDKVIPNDERELLVGIGIAVAAITLCTFAFGIAQAFVNLRVQTKIFTRMQSAIIDRMLRLPNRFFRAAPTGELLKRALMISDVSIGMVSTLSSAISAAIGLVLMLGLCFYYSTQLAFLSLIAAVASAAVTVTTSYLMRRRNIEIQLEGGRNLGFLMQIIQGVSKLQTARAEERAFSGWAEGKGDVLRMTYTNARIEHNASIIGVAISTLATIGLFYVAGTMVLQSQIEQTLNPLAAPLLTIGVFFAFQRAFGSVTGFMSQFFTSFVDAHEQMLKRELVRPFLETATEAKRDRVDAGPLRGRVELRAVSFRYAPDGPLILDGVDIDAHDGEFVAVVGPSGAGKSTIAALILGFETPQAGALLIDGKNIETLEMSGVRRQIGVVLQNDRISGGSIYTAIAGASAITMDQAWLAARDAGLEPDIKAMPMGMHSLIPEGGGTLSGGQRQRLSIARALVQDPRVMLFDEATSALDNRSQEIVSASLRRRRVTRIVIAHRLSTIADADRVFVLQRGRVIESGPPAELREAGGLFARLAQAQEA